MTKTFFPFEHCKKVLDEDEHASFATSSSLNPPHISSSGLITNTSFPRNPPPPGMLDPESLPDGLIDQVVMLDDSGRALVRLKVSTRPTSPITQGTA